jgi:hypothetical protein
MSFLKKYSTLLFFFISLAANAQNQLSSQFDYANNLFKAHQYFDAVTEYKRLLFFDSKNEYAFPANYKIGEAYKSGLKFDEAIKYFSLAEMSAANSEQKYSSKIEIVKTNILRRTTDRAHQLLDEMEKTFYTGVYKDSLNYWRGWNYIFADNWKKASECFAKISPSHELKFLCDGVEKEKVSVTFTKVISYILPGAGQVYTGQYISGILSLSYNVLFGYLTINSFAEERIFDGFAVGSLLWLRFYRGNVQNAEKFAEEKNIETSNKALRYLQNNYQGQKP